MLRRPKSGSCRDAPLPQHRRTVRVHVGGRNRIMVITRHRDRKNQFNSGSFRSGRHSMYNLDFDLRPKPSWHPNVGLVYPMLGLNSPHPKSSPTLRSPRRSSLRRPPFSATWPSSGGPVACRSECLRGWERLRLSFCKHLWIQYHHISSHTSLSLTHDITYLFFLWGASHVQKEDKGNDS